MDFGVGQFQFLRRGLDFQRLDSRVDLLAPWFTNRNKRLIKTPKVHVLDTGLACAVMPLTADQIHQHPVTFGHLLESFVYGELRKQASWRAEAIEFYYYRDKDQYEVDIVMENASGQFVGIEVKAGASVTESDFAGLRRFQRQVNERFAAGVIVYDGKQVLSFGGGLYAAPVSALWEL